MMTMKRCKWTNELSIGNINIDNDHEKLIEVHNDLYDLIELKNSHKEFSEILSNMTDYVLIHFKKEEVYMEEFEYPKLKEHKQYHSNYIYKVAMYNIDLLGTNPPEPKEIIEFIEKWWVNHIMKIDRDYENYKKETGSDAKYGAF